MKLPLDAKALPPGSGRGNLSSRLVLTGERWQSLDLCIHGQRLLWHCWECDDYFKGRKPQKRGYTMSTRQKALVGTVIALFGLLTCFGLAKWALHRFRDSEDRHRVLSIAHYQGRLLKDYVERTKRFPESLPAMVAEEELPPDCVLEAPQGGTTIYTQPSPTAAGTTAVYVVTSLRHQAIVTKDFRIVVSKASRP